VTSIFIYKIICVVTNYKKSEYFSILSLRKMSINIGKKLKIFPI